MKWKTISSEYINKHPYFTARKDVCVTGNNKPVDAYFVVEMPESVTALAITEDGKAIFVKQYRHPVEDILLELPGGFIDEGETPEQGIRRELLEETGYAFNEIVQVGKIAANPGVLNNYTFLFLATGGKKIAEQVFDPHEDIEIVFVPFDEVIMLLKENKIPQSLHAACVFYSLLRMEKLI
ncbi:MAG: NUDIX hydrolase [Chitinophagaceae bacterium]